MTTPATLRAAAAIVEAAAAREGHAHWQRLAEELHALADEMTAERPEPPEPKD